MSTDTLFAGHEMSWEGILTRNGEARTKAIDAEGHMAPVLILDLESPTELRLQMHVEQVFPVGHVAQAEAAARRYRKGQRVTVQAPVQGVRWHVQASHIHTHHNDEPNELQPQTRDRGCISTEPAGTMPRVGESLRLVD